MELSCWPKGSQGNTQDTQAIAKIRIISVNWQQSPITKDNTYTNN